MRSDTAARRGAAWGLLLGLAMATSAAADPAPPPARTPAAPTPPAQTPGEPVLERIVVTAKKRRQDLQTVPQTVDVVGGATVRRLNIFQFDQIQLLIAGLQLSDNGGRGQNVALRGITFDPDTAANPAVDLYLNEVPISQTSSVFQDLYDINQLQVVRGPQGTLRGRTSPAGAILIDTQAPDLSAYGGYVQQSFSDDGLIRTEGAVNAPIVPGKLAVRIAGLFDQNDLYATRDIVTGQTDFNLQHSGRITIAAHPVDWLEITLTHQEANDRTRQLFSVAGDGALGVITPEQNVAVVPGPYTFYDRTSLTTLQAVAHLGDDDLHYTAGYQAVRDEFQRYQDTGALLRGYDTGSQDSAQSINQLTQEVRLQSAGDRRFNYMIGAYYAHQDGNAAVFTPSEIIFQPAPGLPYPGATPILNLNAQVGVEQLSTDYAIFTDESFKVTPDDVLEGGLRWQYENQYRASGYALTIPTIGTLSQALISPNNQKAEYRAWTGLASYTHHFTKDLVLYTSYGQSFRPGGVTYGVSIPLPEQYLIYRPETSYDFEIGTKTTLMGGRLRVNADIFHQAYSGYIARENNIFTTLGYTSINTNGNALARGVEASLDALVTDAWRLSMNLTYADAAYDNARLPCNDFAGTGAPNTNGPPRVIGGGVTSLCTTNGALGAPNWYFSVNTEYDLPLGLRYDGFVRALYSFSARNHLTLQSANQDVRNLASLYVGARSVAGWEVTAWIKNLFNVNGSTNLFGEQFDSGFTTSGQAVNYDTGYRSSVTLRPRELGVTLAYRF